MDTIFALASARGRAGVSVVRISGPKAHDALSGFGASIPAAREASVRRLSVDGELIDEALVLRFDGPQSFTGEDVVELHTHGSTATVNAVLATLSGFEGFREAESGEFTRRALENERLDLAQVEGLSDLIEAETEAQRRQAVRVFAGALGKKVEDWRARVIRAAALLEATIDFVDEDVPVDVYPEVRELLSGLKADLAAEVAGVGIAERIRDGFEVAIVGAPNVGKSTLLNALAGRDAAITSEVAGTTRDVIEVRMDIAGLPVTLLDTAGIRTASDRVETIGISRAIERAERADLRVILLEAPGMIPVMEPEADDLVLVSRSDIVPGGDLSALTGEGIDRLVAAIGDRLGERTSNVGVAMRARHRRAMEDAIDALGIAQDRLESAPELVEVIAEELRVAIRALDSIVGRVDVEHLLGEIFSSFCIGK